jgi:hypothetical protein
VTGSHRRTANGAAGEGDLTGRPGPLDGQERSRLVKLAEGLSGDEAVAILAWLARNHPTWCREAIRNSPSERVRFAYRAAGRPHS